MEHLKAPSQTFWPTPKTDADTAQNTDRELWREREGDYYADSIHLTETGGIGINCGGEVIVAPLRSWFAGLKSVRDSEQFETLVVSCSVLCSLAMIYLEGRLWDIETIFSGNVPENPVDGLTLLSIPFSKTPDLMLNVAKAAQEAANVIVAEGYWRFYRPMDLGIPSACPHAHLVSARQGVAIRIHEEHGLYQLSVACGR